MYGKHFDSMYTGSMFGAGPVVFAVWGYVISKAVPDKVVGAQVELNPDLLAAIIGTDRGEIAKAVEFLCSPDSKSRSKESEGRRLIRLGEFDYQVVNGRKYREIRDEEKRREQNRIAQDKFRSKVKAGGRKERKTPKSNSGPLPGETAYVNAMERGASQEELDRMTDETVLDR